MKAYSEKSQRGCFPSEALHALELAGISPGLLEDLMDVVCFLERTCRA